MDGLKRKMAIGVAWNTLFKVARRGLGLISTLILARLLVPADFGLVALATAIVGAFELMTAFNFEVALIQNQSAERRHYDTAWTFNVLFGVTTGAILTVMAASAASFFAEPRLEDVLYVLAFSFALASFSNIAVVDLQKELRFAEDFRLRAFQHFARFAVTVPLAFWMKSYWALVIGILVGNIVKVASTYWVMPYKPRLTLSARRDLLGFSMWLLANRIMFYLRNRSTELFLGRLAGVQTLGLFTVSFEISNMPTSELVAPINRADDAWLLEDGARSRQAAREFSRGRWIDRCVCIARRYWRRSDGAPSRADICSAKNGWRQYPSSRCWRFTVR